MNIKFLVIIKIDSQQFFALEDFIVKFAIWMLELFWELKGRRHASWLVFILLLAKKVLSFEQDRQIC